MSQRRLVCHGAIVAVVMSLVSLGAPPAAADGGGLPQAVRFATFNASLNRFNAGDLAAEQIGRAHV